MKIIMGIIMGFVEAVFIALEAIFGFFGGGGKKEK